MSENGTLDDRYLGWLYEQIGSPGLRNRSRTYWELSRQLYTKRFVWYIHNDDNRVMDGIELRIEFLNDEEDRESRNSSWLSLECSMLEMLVALSRRAAFESDKAPAEWFWIFMENLDLTNYWDNRYNERAAEEVDKALNRLIDRTYDSDGVGGIFPLQNPNRDQRKIEIWYQLADYLMENYYVIDESA